MHLPHHPRMRIVMVLYEFSPFSIPNLKTPFKRPRLSTGGSESNLYASRPSPSAQPSPRPRPVTRSSASRRNAPAQVRQRITRSAPLRNVSERTRAQERRGRGAPVVRSLPSGGSSPRILRSTTRAARRRNRLSSSQEIRAIATQIHPRINILEDTNLPYFDDSSDSSSDSDLDIADVLCFLEVLPTYRIRILSIDTCLLFTPPAFSFPELTSAIPLFRYSLTFSSIL